MNNVIYSIAGILIPFIGTSLGSAFVFFLKKDMNEKIKKIIIGFASRCYDSGINMVTHITSSRNVRRTRKHSMDSSINAE